MVADVEISIVSLGDVAQLSRCVETLPLACAGVAWRLTLVDNSAGRGLDLSAIHATVPSASVLRSEGRRGFAANQNLVLQPLVIARRARYVLVLNDDTELDAGAVARLVRHADGDPRIGAVSPLIRDRGGRLEDELFAWPTVPDQALRMMVPKLASRRPRGTGWLNGAAMLVRTATLEDVGLFDSSFFLFFEETDLCLRMVQAGWTLEVCPSASLMHHRHGTTGQRALHAEVGQQMLRSRYLFFRKHRGIAPARVLSALSRCALMLRAAKALIEVSDADSRDTANFLWRLARYEPAQPTALELSAGVERDHQRLGA